MAFYYIKNCQSVEEGRQYLQQNKLLTQNTQGGSKSKDVKPPLQSIKKFKQIDFKIDEFMHNVGGKLTMN